MILIAFEIEKMKEGDRLVFLDDKFLFDNILSESMNIKLVTLGDDEILNEYGLPYEEALKTDNSFNKNPCYLEDETTVEPITLQFCLCSEHGEAYEWDDYTLENICNWFWQREFKPFISFDNIEEIYYLKARKIIKKYTKDKKGVLEIEFQPYTNYAYRNFQKSITVKDTREIKLNNVSNVDEEYAPVIDIECLEEGDITIRNASISDNEEDSLVISGLELNEKITIDNLYYTVLNSTGENRFNIVNRKWIRLRRGVNILKFTGNCKVSIKCKYPIIK
ncbi:hypothetical protein O0984_11610 [Clostridioides difficile]|nr:hypothetical protein [Clostridioides difficile]